MSETDTTTPEPHRTRPDRNLALELVRVTEAGALAAARWVGRGQKEEADGAAVEAMRELIGTVTMRGVVVIGEGEKDEAPMLFNGEEVGDGSGPECDVAVDPVEGTTLTAEGQNNAIAVLAVAPRGAMFDPSAVFYMDKLVVGPEAAEVVHLAAGVEHNVRAIARAKGIAPTDVTVVVLDRPRHEDLITKIRAAGARIRLISHGDVGWAIDCLREGTGVDALMGVGGTPEGIITACAVKSMGGAMQAKLWPKDDEERQQALDAGLDLEAVLTVDDLVRGDDCFVAATGITDGTYLHGVRYGRNTATTHSLVMRSRSGTVRTVESVHQLDKLRSYSSVDVGGSGGRRSRG